MGAGLGNDILTATGLLGCAWWAGATCSISLLTVPPLIEHSADPSSALKVWHGLYKRGAATGPKVAIVSFLALASAAYGRHTEGLSWAPHLVGGVLSLAIVPWTLGVMLPTNKELAAGAEGQKEMSRVRATELLEKWSALNLARGVFPLLGAAVVLWDVLA